MGDRGFYGIYDGGDKAVSLTYLSLFSAFRKQVSQCSCSLA